MGTERDCSMWELIVVTKIKCNINYQINILVTKSISITQIYNVTSLKTTRITIDIICGLVCHL